MRFWRREIFRQLSLAQQLGLQIGGVFVLLLLGMAVIAQVSIGHLTATQLPPLLERNVALRAAQQGQLFAQAQDSVTRLQSAWLERARAIPATAVRPRFDALFERSADGVWRVKPAAVDAKRKPTFYLQHGQGLSDDARLRAVVSYELLADQGPALVPPFFSAYVDFVEKGLMVFSNGIDWGRSATPATDNFDYPTMQGSDPRRNPDRKRFWTPVYFDGEAKVWMVSVIQPLDWQGRWVGTVGHDISVDALLKIEADVDGGSVPMIISGDGHLIAHPDLRDRISRAQGQLALTQLNDPVLTQAYQRVMAQGNQGHAELTADGKYWVAWARIPGPDWWSVTVLPQAVIDARIRTGVYWIVLGGLLALTATLLVLRRVIRRLVRVPLGQVTQAVDQLADQLAQNTDLVPIKPGSSSDLRRLTSAFDALGAQLLARQREAQAQAAALQHEVAERRQAENAVRELNATLEDRVHRRTQALAQAQDELVRKETLAGLGALVAGVAHELNTPIGNGLIAVDTAHMAVLAALDQIQTTPVRRSELLVNLRRADEGLTLALGNLHRSAGLVRDFKQVSVDRASLQRRLFNLKSVCEEVVKLLPYTLGVAPQGRLARAGIEVQLRIPDDVQMDSYPGAFGQVLSNLVENAFVHGFDGTSVGQVTITLESADERSVHLSVADNGGGISAEHQSQIFNPFFTTKLGAGGSGLGLHLVYSLVNNVLGGTIELEASSDEGTVFRLVLSRLAPGP
ncbi:sensor histidine kinase [Roseateles koreensis]|uniref:histidine kinase n=1 Tax=Roseateles koreensis TaxID=2987526 RepID=A0ABT5KP82_9BURK|nr:ATP-binding protein [Roseateles koreensis]MDC8784714.1 ATP-binding protein [Roseateles koreensis]